jgi:AraC-like DNA-binding protein
MPYLRRAPAPPLNEWIRAIWYAHTPPMPHPRERVLPNGCVQIIINLDRDFTWQCSEAGRVGRQAGSLVAGARSVYEIVDSADLVEVAGILFEPAGFASFACGPVDLFSNGIVALEDVWGARAKTLRERMLDAAGAEAKLRAVEEFLLRNFAATLTRDAVVAFALRRFAESPSRAAVECVAAETGWSVRHFSQRFREQVGMSPKVWLRVQRFQAAVGQLYAGAGVRWAEMALECGYYDQSHFANDFRAFSGIDATTYSTRRGPWANHVAIG